MHYPSLFQPLEGLHLCTSFYPLLLCSASWLQHFSSLPSVLVSFLLYQITAIGIQAWCSASCFIKALSGSCIPLQVLTHFLYLISSQQSSSTLLHLLSQILPSHSLLTHHFTRAALVKVTSDLHVANPPISSQSSIFKIAV